MSASTPYDLLVFDCDGVLLDTAGIKTHALGTLFSHLGTEAVEYIQEYNKGHGGVSRYEKFAHYFDHFYNRPINHEELTELDRRFNELALDAIMALDPLPGVRDFLEQHASRWPCYVASGAPERDLRIILKKTALADYFKGIYGSPAPKPRLLAEIVRREQADPARTLMIGDSTADLMAAQVVGTQFLGIGPFPQPHVWLTDLTALEAFVFSGTLPESKK